MSAPTTQNERRRWSRLLAVPVIAYTAAIVAAAIALRAATDVWWPATALAYAPRWVLGLPLPVLALAVVVTRRWRLAAAVLAAAVALAIVLDFRIPFGRRSGGGQTLVVMTQNAANDSTSPDRLRALLDSAGVHILAVQECRFEHADWAEKGWRFHRDFGNCLLSRYPIRVYEAREPSDVRSFGGHGGAARYVIDTPDGPIAVVNVHLATARGGLDEVLHHGFKGGPALSANTRMRERETDVIRTWVDQRTTGTPTLVLGDFNMPVESAIYRRNWSWFGNAFSAAGFGLGWSKRTRRSGVRIDHVLYSEEFACARAMLAPAIGSDHRGVIAHVALRARR